MESHLDKKEVVAAMDLPMRNLAEKILLRARVPDGWKVRSAQAGATKLAVARDGTVDITSLVGRQTLRFAVARN
jgi:hypothetical protein